MSKQAKKEERKKARELERQQQEQKEVRKNMLQKVLIAAIAITGALIFFLKRAYIGYFLGAVAIPYGVYGMFVPYKSAREYAKQGYDRVYSVQFGSLMFSLGVLGIIYSKMLPDMAGNKLFLIALLVYMVFFFVVLNLLQKRYIKPPVVDSDAPTLEELAQMAKEAKKEAKEAKKKEKQQ